MSFLSKTGDFFEDAGEAVYDAGKKTVKAVGNAIETVTDPLQKMADNKVFRAIDKMYKEAIPEPYGSYMKAMTSTSALVGAALSKAKLLPGNGVLLTGGQSLFPGHPTYNEITKKGKAAQVKAMRDLLSAAATTPEAQKALAALKKADPKLYAQLAKEAQSKVFESVHHKVSSLLSPEARALVNTGLKTHPVIHRGIPESVLSTNRAQLSAALRSKASAGDKGAANTLKVINALRAAQDGNASPAIALIQQNQLRASTAKALGPTTTTERFYKVVTPSGRTVLVPAEDIGR
jgi:hypothetical protein